MFKIIGQLISYRNSANYDTKKQCWCFEIMDVGKIIVWAGRSPERANDLCSTITDPAALTELVSVKLAICNVMNNVAAEQQTKDAQCRSTIKYNVVVGRIE